MRRGDMPRANRPIIAVSSSESLGNPTISARASRLFIKNVRRHSASDSLPSPQALKPLRESKIAPKS